MDETPPKLKVFLCHANEDMPVVRKLYDRLRADGFDPWLDKDELNPGEKWHVEIGRVMRKSQAVIVCLSKKAITKEGFFQAEIKEARRIQEEKPEGAIFFIPLQLEECDPPPSMEEIQWGKYFEPGGYEKLVKSLNKCANQVQAAPGVEKPGPGKNVVAIIAIALLCLFFIYKIALPKPVKTPIPKLIDTATVPLILSSTLPSLASTPTVVLPSETPVPISTDMPTLTFMLPPVDTETLTSSPTATNLPTPVFSCSWKPYSTFDPSISVGEHCLEDLSMLGVSGIDRVFFYRESGMNVGIYGLSRRIESEAEFNVDISIKKMISTRFLILLSQNERGYQSSIGFRIVPVENGRKIQLIRYDAQGYDTGVAALDELSLWGGKLRLTLVFNGTQVRAYVNDAYFGQTQITFAERNLFLGYQVETGGAKRPYLDLIVDVDYAK